MKKKFKNFLCNISIILCLTYICTSLFFQIDSYSFNSKNVISNIEKLTSSNYNGRLTGTYGNFSAALFIKNSFKNANLQPYFNSYMQSFTAKCPTLNNEKPELIVKNSSGKKIKEYKYGVDYKEDMINFRTSDVNITRMDKLSVNIDSIIILQGTHKYLFYVNNKNNFNFRSSFNFNSLYDFCINITPELYNDILNALKEDYILSVKLPYTISSKYAYNIVGMIKGSSNTLPPLILSAHYDHLGCDYLGNRYNGALDNASGTSFLLELAKHYSSIIKPKRDIIFVAFTGEEFGLVGSKEFVNKNYNNIKDGISINFDMVGAPNVPITLMNSDCEINTTLCSKLESICKDNLLNYDIQYKNSSDHASFSNANIPSVTICNADFSRIHTPDDNACYIDKNSIDNAYDLISNSIHDLAFDKYIILLYSKKLTLFITIIFLLLTILKYKTNKEKHQDN